MKRKISKTLSFQVIAGELRGRRLSVPDLGITRPPLARLRKALFDFLQPHLESAIYLDLFSGTGSYLFEAVSRGAQSVTGIELEARLADAINNHARDLGVDTKLRCLCEDVFTAINRIHTTGKRFDIITMAPPQYKGYIDKTLAALEEHPLLTPDGLLICQHDTNETNKIDFRDFVIRQQRKYGNTTFTVLCNP
jgi:16S rRNA (guanine(966)-N(2))-methyltransferase RsmD